MDLSQAVRWSAPVVLAGAALSGCSQVPVSVTSARQDAKTLESVAQQSGYTVVPVGQVSATGADLTTEVDESPDGRTVLFTGMWGACSEPCVVALDTDEQHLQLDVRDHVTHRGPCSAVGIPYVVHVQLPESLGERHLTLVRGA